MLVVSLRNIYDQSKHPGALARIANKSKVFSRNSRRGGFALNYEFQINREIISFPEFIKLDLMARWWCILFNFFPPAMSNFLLPEC